MTLVRVHPEHLIERLLDGTLSEGERERLERHLAECPACRFDLAVREDLEADAAHTDGARLSLLVEDAVALAPPSEPRPSAKPLSSRRAPGRRRLAIAVAGAFVLAASAAAARSGVVETLRRAVRAVVEQQAEVTRTETASSATTPSRAPSPAVETPATSAPLASLPSAEPPSPTSAEATRSEAPSAPNTDGPGPKTPSVSGIGTVATSDPPGETAAELFAKAGAARLAGRSEALALYDRLQQRHPTSPEAGLARAIVARMQLDRGDPQAALAGFDAYIARGGGALGEDAVAGRALALGRLGKADEERAAWTELLARFPRSGYADMARRRIAAARPSTSVAPRTSPASDDPL
jgi:TolA-binding protein